MNKELEDFISFHKLDIKDFFNANGRPVSSCYNEMKSKDKLFAYNTTSCSNYGHTIRDRHGHCIVCNTANIEYSLRPKRIGFIYIACSLRKEITKVGMTTQLIKTRVTKINSSRVGNTDDWVILNSVKCAKANPIELLIHKELEKYQVKGNLYGKTESKKIFRCSYQKAKELLDNVLRANDVKVLEEKSYLSNKDKYKFRNLISK